MKKPSKKVHENLIGKSLITPGEFSFKTVELDPEREMRHLKIESATRYSNTQPSVDRC
jgi:hypothetical protein